LKKKGPPHANSPLPDFFHFKKGFFVNEPAAVPQKSVPQADIPLDGVELPVDAPDMARGVPLASSLRLARLKDAPPHTRPPAVLEARNLRKRFGKREVVRDVSPAVGAGEIVGLLGRNGAGKTTSFRMMMGILRPDEGRVFLDGRDITRLPMYQRARRGVGYLAQEPSVFQRLNVEENLTAVLELLEPSSVEREKQLNNLIAELGLERVRRNLAWKLSGGERRRLEIARAMALKPRVILFDEPFSGIDPIAVGEIQSILRELASRGVGVLLTDHNVRETLAITNHAYLIDDGCVLIQGEPREIVNNPEARERYLGHDFRLDF
jgi:lipopolysaccharide export system ATP-binding protein